MILYEVVPREMVEVMSYKGREEGKDEAKEIWLRSFDLPLHSSAPLPLFHSNSINLDSNHAFLQHHPIHSPSRSSSCESPLYYLHNERKRRKDTDDSSPPFPSSFPPFLLLPSSLQPVMSVRHTSGSAGSVTSSKMFESVYTLSPSYNPPSTPLPSSLLLTCEEGREREMGRRHGMFRPSSLAY